MGSLWDEGQFYSNRPVYFCWHHGYGSRWWGLFVSIFLEWIDGYYPDGPFYNDIGLFKEAIMTFELVDIMKTVETKFADE